MVWEIEKNLPLILADPSRLEQVFIKGDKGAIVLTAIGEEAVLTAMSRPDAKLGMIFLEMRRAAEDLVKLVG